MIRLRPTFLVGGLAAAVLLAGATNAVALTGKPIKIGTPDSIGGRPSVAVDRSGTAFIAWNNDKNLGGASNFIQYCVLPPGATACAHSGSLIPADSAAYIDHVQVLATFPFPLSPQPYPDTIVVLADVFGAAQPDASHYEPVQEWQSTDGGATFSIVNGGQSVANGVIGTTTTSPLGAFALPSQGGAEAGVLGFGWNTAGDQPPTFNAFPLYSPPECSRAACGSPYASLAPSSQPDQIGNQGAQFASQGWTVGFGSAGGNPPGVLAIFNTNFTSGNLGCSDAKTVPFGTAFAYGSGPQKSGNDYNLSPGSPGSAWQTAVTQADCNVEYPAVAGGPSGFGVIEVNDLTKQTVYHRFDQTRLNFDTPMVTVANERELDPSISQDDFGGIYATFLGGGAGGPIALSYSGDGGSTWLGPATLAPNPGGTISNLSSSLEGGGTGPGWATWTNNGSVYAQQFDRGDAVTPAAVGTGGTATSAGPTVTVSVSCAILPCTVTVTITAGGVLVAAYAGVARKRTTTLGSGRFTIRRRGLQKLTVGLSKAGRKTLAAHHGRLAGTLIITGKIYGKSVTAKRSIKIKPGSRKSSRAL